MIGPYPTGQSLSVFGVERTAKATLISVFGWIDLTPTHSIYITDHVALAKSRLIEEFKPRPRINSLVEIQAMRVQGLEDVGIQLLSSRSLSSAYGVQLDYLGEMVGEPREGKNDDEYRLAIATRVHINKSSGTADDVISFIKAVTNVSSVAVSEPSPAHLRVQINGNEIPEMFADKVNKVKAAGVLLRIVNLYGDDPFVFDNDDLPIEEGLGFDELGYLESGDHVGGQITELIA